MGGDVEPGVSGSGGGGREEAGGRAPGAPEDRILSRAEAVRRYGRPRPFTLVFTNGCFDLLHRGHVSLLHRARTLGDRLLVGLNSDASVRRLKGAGRPLLPEGDRARLLAGLRSVDGVTVFEEDTPRTLIEALLPDHLVKGADYRREEVAGAGLVEAAGGRVHLLPLEEGVSTTALLARIRRRAGDAGT